MEQDELLKYAIAVLERRGLRYALVGSFASGIWGETRFTPDMDIAGILKIGDELVDRDYLAEQAAQLGVQDDCKVVFWNRQGAKFAQRRFCWFEENRHFPGNPFGVLGVLAVFF